MIKIIAPLGDIPERCIVTKIRGSKEFKVVRKLSIFTQLLEDKREIVCTDGFTFLIADNAGVVEMHPNSTEFVWLAEEWQVLEFIGP